MNKAVDRVIPEILAVIPCLNEERHLERLVRKIVRHSGPSVLVIIADGGSSDRSAEIARALAAEYPNVMYLHNPKRIQSAAVNLAVELYGGRPSLLLRLDAHADYPDDYCAVLAEEQRVTGAAAVVVSMKTVGDSGFQRAAAAAQNSFLGNGGAAHRTFPAAGKWVDHGHHALISLDAFRAVRGYDENFSHNEDAELDIRLRKNGYNIWLTGKTSCTYYPRSHPVPLFRQYFRFGQGRARTLMKHRAIPRLRQMVPMGVAPAAGLALASPLLWSAALPFVAWMSVCLIYGFALGVKNRRLDTLLAGPAAMLMHFAWSLGFSSGILKALRRGT